MRIGHASTGENGGRNNRPGDQTGKEVKISNWYSNGWNQVIRAKDPSLAEKMAKICETLCNNPCVGYDMNDRNTLHNELRKLNYDVSKLKTNCETDCSAFQTVIAIAAGVKSLEYTSNAPVCSTMAKAFGQTGMFEIITDNKYMVSPDYLKRGDILINTKKHTVMALDDGSKAYSYNKEHTSGLPELRLGDKGETVKYLQTLLRNLKYGCAVDGDFGSITNQCVIHFQTVNHLKVDGIVGEQTWKALGIGG